MALRVALVGAGQVASVHLEALAETDAVELVGIYDQDLARARQRAEANRIPRAYASWDELLRDEAVECVAVLLPHDLHERFATEALAAGKHVVCEKPLGQSVAECDRMLAAAARAGRRLFPVHNRVYGHAVERMGEIVRDGKIGQVVLAQTTGFEGPRTVGVRPWLATRRGGGGVLMAQAVHPAYALRWMLGDVARVSCQFGGLKVVDMTAEDTAIATLKFASGAVAEMTATFGIAHGPFDHSITLHGRDGYLHLGARAGGSRQRFALVAIAPQLFGDAELHEVELPMTDLSATAFRRMWEDYAGGIVEGTPTRVVGEDGKRAVEIVEAAYRSNETGRTIDLPLES
jgi:UDP-N-acetyl-2-amino-2-deoxyglucuronate dehydrogenase